MFSGRKLPEIATQRLLLRRVREDDAEFFMSLDTDPRVMEHIHTGPLSREEAANFAESVIYLAQHKWRFGRWVVEERASGDRVGWVELHKLSGPHRDDLQIAYQFLPERWGKGLATEAANALIDYAFGPGGLDRVGAVVRSTNAASIRLLQRCGFAKTDDEAWDEAGPCELWFRYSEMEHGEGN